MKYEEALKKVSEYGQAHVLQYYEELSEEGKVALLAQIDQTDFSVLAKAKESDKAEQFQIKVKVEAKYEKNNYYSSRKRYRGNYC